MIYMDNGATSWPKPKNVRTAINEALDNAGNPGRGTHSYTVWSAMKLNEVRQKLAKLFHIKDAQRIAFTMNATHALNIAVNLCYGQIVTTAMEHNSVLRPTVSRGYYYINAADSRGGRLFVLGVEDVPRSVLLVGALDHFGESVVVFVVFFMTLSVVVGNSPARRGKGLESLESASLLLL